MSLLHFTPRNGSRSAGVAVLLCCLTSACLRSVTDPDISLPAGRTRVLFIGNSLTYYNDLPAMLVALARQGGDTVLDVASIALPDYALEDHWNDGRAVRALQQGRWEFVVMQQGPSSLPENQVHLRTWTERFAPLIKASGATPVLYMVWPAESRLGDFPGVLASYRGAAAAVSGIFAPAGDAWTAVRAADPSIAVYGPDGFHPAPAGSYLAALVLLGRLTGMDPEALPDAMPTSLQGLAGTPQVIATLQRAAKTALTRNPATP